MMDVAEKNPDDIKSENAIKVMPLSSTLIDQKFSQEYVNLTSLAGKGTVEMFWTALFSVKRIPY
jgi:hypothetical protein